MLWLGLAVRNVFANGRRSAFVAGTILVSVVALLLFAGYMHATRVGLEYSTVRGGIGHLQMSGAGGFDRYSDEPLQFGLTPDARTSIEDAADRLSQVSRTVPRLAFSGLLSNGPRTLSVSATGIDPISENAAFGARRIVSSGQLLSGSTPEDGAVLGVELAKRLGVRPGDVVTLITTTVSGSLNAQDLTVLGTVGSGIPQTDLYLLQIMLPTAQRLLATDKLSAMAILLTEGGDLPEASEALLRSHAGLEIRTWRQLSPAYDQVVGMYERLFAVFGAFLLCVTTFSIATLILTSVLERTREVGVMRSLGIRANRVRLSFMLEALTLGAIGLACGTLFAFLAASGLNALDLTAPPPPGRNVGHPFRIIWDTTAMVGIWAAVLILTALAAWAASSRVAKLRVVTALGAI